jgi:hypothetical protein
MRIRCDKPGALPGASIKIGVDGPSGVRHVFRSSLGMVCDVPEADARALLAMPGFSAVDPVGEVIDLQHLDRTALSLIAARFGEKFHHKTSEAKMREKVAALLAQEAANAHDAGSV